MTLLTILCVREKLKCMAGERSTCCSKENPNRAKDRALCTLLELSVVVT